MSARPFQPRFHTLLGLGTLAILIAFLGVWGSFARLSGAVIATGTVVVENERQVVEHDEGGVVERILVRDGDSVEIGDPLVRLNGKLLRSELAILDGQFYELLTRQARLRAEAELLDQVVWPETLNAVVAENDQALSFKASQERLFSFRKQNLSAQDEQLAVQVSQLEEQGTGVIAQIEALEEQQRLINEELAATQDLFEKGLARAPQVKSLEREAARLRGETGRLVAEGGRIKANIAELEISRIRLVSDRQEEALTALRDLDPQLNEISNRRLSLFERLDRLTIKAPVAGVVFGSLLFAENSVISPAEPILYIVPDDQPLLIAARVDAVHIDQITLGQSTSLRFSTFDQRFTPELWGAVSGVSADVVVDEQTGAQFYELRMHVDDTELEKLGDQKLIPGPPVEAFVQTGERSPLHYLTKPLTDYFARAWREE